MYSGYDGVFTTVNTPEITEYKSRHMEENVYMLSKT